MNKKDLRMVSEAQRICDEVIQYFLDDPDATWDDAFRDIENHYAHAASMRTAMHSVAKRRQCREKFPSSVNRDDRNGFLFTNRNRVL